MIVVAALIDEWCDGPSVRSFVRWIVLAVLEQTRVDFP